MYKRAFRKPEGIYAAEITENTHPEIVNMVIGNDIAFAKAGLYPQRQPTEIPICLKSDISLWVMVLSGLCPIQTALAPPKSTPPFLIMELSTEI